MQLGKDAFTMWAVAGVIGVVTRDIYSYFAKLIGLAKFQIWVVGADIFLDKSEIFTFWGSILGFLNDLVIGATLGVLIGLLLTWTGRDNYLVKGMGTGLIAWMSFFGILFHNLPDMNLAPPDALSNISAFIGHALFGIVTAWVLVKLAPTDLPDDAKKNGEKKKALHPADEFVGAK